MAVKATKVLTQEKIKVIKSIMKSNNLKKITLEDNSIIITPEEWEEFYKEIYTDVTKEFGESVLESYDDTTDSNDEWLVAALIYSIPVVASRIKEVISTSEKRVNKLIRENIDNGGSTKDLIISVNELYERDIPVRSKNISSTEVITAANIGIRFAVKSLSNLVKKKWIAVMDDRTRDSHWNTNGEVRNIDELYSNGLMFPGDPAAPADEVCNCRCIESFII